MAFRIRHKRTGLFYIPSRLVKNKNGSRVKSNLSKTGKIYFRTPTLEHIGSYYDHTLPIANEKNMYNTRKHLVGKNNDDWQIEEV